jgi:DNA-binding MarR family transcriptional regulator
MDKTERIASQLVELIGVFSIMRNREAARQGKSRPFDPHYMILCILMHESLPISEIGKRLHRSRPNMTAIIDRLIGEGKVVREHDKNDRRVVNIVITHKGRQYLEERRKIIRDNIKRNISILSRRDQEILCDSLENVTSIAGKMSGD